MYDPDDCGELSKDVGRRLALARKALKLQQDEIATALGASQPQYSQYETGRRLLTLPPALRLCERYNLTLDWLYRGDPSGLPIRMLEAIKKARGEAVTHG